VGAFHGVKDFEGDFVGSSALVSGEISTSLKISTSIKIFEFCNLGSLRSGKICLQNPLCGSLDTLRLSHKDTQQNHVYYFI
jgi:hypothetical protein